MPTYLGHLFPAIQLLQLLLRVFWMQQQSRVFGQQQLAAELLQDAAPLVAEVDANSPRESLH